MGREVHEEGREQRRTPAPVPTISNALLHSAHRGGSGQGKAGNVLIHARAHKTSEVLMTKDCKTALARVVLSVTRQQHVAQGLRAPACGGACDLPTPRYRPPTPDVTAGVSRWWVLILAPPVPSLEYSTPY